MGLSYAELSNAKYSVEIKGRQLTYVIEKDGNVISVNANPLYEFLKEMFTTNWQDSNLTTHPNEHGEE